MQIKGLDNAIRRMTIDEDKIKQALEQGGELILAQAKPSCIFNTCRRYYRKGSAKVDLFSLTLGIKLLLVCTKEKYS